MTIVMALVLALQETAIDVQLRTSDGDTVLGTARLSPFKLKTAFGEATIDPAKLQSIAFEGAKAKVTLIDRTSLSGTLELKELVVETSAGKLTVALEKIAAIEVSPAGSKPPPPPRVPSYSSRPFGRYQRLRPHFCGDLRHVVLFDGGKGEVVFYELATGATTVVPVENEPRAVAERDGKLYVSNFGSQSLSVIDIASKKSTGRIALSRAPAGIAIAKSTLYYAFGGKSIMAVELPLGREKGTLTDRKGQTLETTAIQLAVSADGRVLYAQGAFDWQPSAVPAAFELDGLKASPLGAPAKEDHQALIVDFRGGRVYGGANVYSLDLRQVTAKTGSNIAVPHPTLPVVLGGKPGGVTFFEGSALLCLDEETLTPLKEVSIGRSFCFIFPTEKAVYVATNQHVYEVPTADIVPESARRKPKAVRMAEVKPEDVAKAESLAAEGRRLLDGGKAEAALAKFQESAKIDPLGGGQAGAGSALLALKRADDAIEHLRKASPLPLRAADGRVTCLVLLGRAYAQAGRHDEAIESFVGALRLGPGSAALFVDVGESFVAQKRDGLAYVAFGRALRIDGRNARAREKTAELARSIRQATAGQCPSCQGTGKREKEIEEGGKVQKQTEKCAACDGVGRAWQRPCVECLAAGSREDGESCRPCWGRGYELVPDRD